MKCSIKNDTLAWLSVGVLLFNVPGCIASVLTAGSAFYKQVILKHPYGIELRVTPDAFRSIEGFTWCRSYCSINKARVPKMPETITV
jgi:hypothetical protein